MNFVKLFLNTYGHYSYINASNIAMCLLKDFLTSDARLTHKEWALADKYYPDSCFTETCGGNITFLEKDHGYIFLNFTDSISNVLADLIMSREQFVQLLTDWSEKVLKLSPKNVILIQKNNNFIIETNNYSPETNHVNLMLENNFYERIYESSFEMAILGVFLSRDVRWDYVDNFKTWEIDWKVNREKKRIYAIDNTIVTLERTKGYIYFTNENPNDDSIEPITYFKISTQQFLQLLDDWQEKVCNQKPKRVCIKHENNEFTIETSN